MTENLKVIVLDAMGVIYAVADDLHNLLCPFIAEKGGIADISQIEQLYLSASIGRMSSFEFWKAVDVDPKFEDDYIRLHKLSDGLLDFLEQTKQRGNEVWCLSNDLSEWSSKRRISFGLEKYFKGYVISGDVGLRKPDPAIFQLLIKQANLDHNAIFVDDYGKNLDSAIKIGFETVMFNPKNQNLSSNNKHRILTNFREIIPLLN